MTRNFIAFLLSLFLIALIILTTPTTSLEILIKGLGGTYKKGTTIDFSIEANISLNEHIPVNFIVLNITGSSNYECKIYMNNTVEGCSFLTVSSIEYDSFGYGYGYGYENSYHYLGYGYGYGPSKIRINLVMDTTTLNGTYNIKAEINTGVNPNSHIFSSSTYSFTIEEQDTQLSNIIGGPIKYFLEILDIKNKDNSYLVRVRNGGKEKLKVYLIIELPEINQTYEPIILNAGEEASLSYTLTNGSYSYRVIVVGEADGIKLTRYVNMYVENENQTNEESKPTEVFEEKNVISKPTEEKSLTTGLFAGILDVANKYKLIMALAVVVIAVVVIKFR